MVNLLIGLFLGISNYIFHFLPFNFLKPIPIITFSAIIVLPINLVTNKLSYKIPKILLSLLAWGIVIGLIRYFAFYNDNTFIISPIFRQAVAFSFGIILFLNLKAWFKKTTFEALSNSVLASSFVFLIIGIYQIVNESKVNEYLRIQGLFTEPSYYGEYLVLILAPLITMNFGKFRSLNNNHKATLITLLLLWTLNLFFTQSGTAVLKLGTLAVTCFLFIPSTWKLKALILIIGLIASVGLIFVKPGYVQHIFMQGMVILKNPDTFFQYHTFYDRFYPIYAAVIKAFSLDGFLGLGFGGDYFEFKNLFPPSTYAEMMFHKPMFSYFNSFASKVILYFGIFGIGLVVYLFKFSLSLKNHWIKIGFFNVLLSSLWGVSSFAIPYLWFWYALACSEKKSNS